jgi:hypothetical protein
MSIVVVLTVLTMILTALGDAPLALACLTLLVATAVWG